jgi:hypothetical protein
MPSVAEGIMTACGYSPKGAPSRPSLVGGAAASTTHQYWVSTSCWPFVARVAATSSAACTTAAPAAAAAVETYGGWASDSDSNDCTTESHRPATG